MTFAEGMKFVTLRTLGNFLVLLSLYGVGATFGPALYYEVQFHVMQVRGVHFTIHPATTKTTKPSPSVIASKTLDTSR
jgi:hypothetical protein